MPSVKQFALALLPLPAIPAVAPRMERHGPGRRQHDRCVKVTLSQVTVGFQFGGQAYSEIISFDQKSSLDGFEHGDFAFAAEGSAVALKSGASANAAYRNGVAVFTIAKGGLMYEASIGGQKFSFKPY